MITVAVGSDWLLRDITLVDVARKQPRRKGAIHFQRFPRCKFWPHLIVETPTGTESWNIQRTNQSKPLF